MDSLVAYLNLTHPIQVFHCQLTGKSHLPQPCLMAPYSSWSMQPKKVL